jgi:hypothetical protein
MAVVAPRGNLDSRAQGAQMRVGLFALAIALGAVVMLAHSGAAPGYRSLAFAPFLVAAYGVLSALYGTCGMTAIAGRRITSEGTERIADRDELASQRKTGARVLAISIALSAVATALFVNAA